MIKLVKPYYKKYKIVRLIILSILGIKRLIFLLVIMIRFRFDKNRLLIIGPTHSNHLRNFSLRLSEVDHSRFIRTLNINSYPYSTVNSFFKRKLLIDYPLYFIFGNGFYKSGWEKELLINATTSFNSHIIWLLQVVIKVYKPKKVWIHDLQSGGYLFNSIFDSSDLNIQVFASAWGNDLFMFANAPEHRSKLKELMAKINYLHVESHKEKNLAIDLGFKGEILPVSNVTMTSIDLYNSYFKNLNSNEKEIFVVIKGSYFLRSNILAFILQLSSSIDFWRDKKIIIINPSEEDSFHFNKLKYEYSLQIELIKELSRENFVKLLSKSKFHLILNISDGIVNSATEAVFVGCIPVISSTCGLVDSLTPFLAKNIVYDFNRVDFKEVFDNLDKLEKEKKTLLLNGLREIYTEKLYSPDIQKHILEKFLND